MGLGRLIVGTFAVVAVGFTPPAFVSAQEPYQFEISPSIRGVLPDSSIKEVQSALEPLHIVTSILQASSQAEPKELARAADLSRRTLSLIESRSLTLRMYDPLALFWTNLISDGWFVAGWVDLESGDLTAAESYLRASWWLSQDRSSGLQLARLLEAKGDRTAATHLLELVSVCNIDNPMGLMGSSFPTNDDVKKSYQRLTGKPLPDSVEKRKEFQNELGRQWGALSVLPSTRLDGNAIFLVSVKRGGKLKAEWYLNDEVLAPLASALETRTIDSIFPSGSNVSLLREMYVSCTPEKGCKGNLRTPSFLDFPGSHVDWKTFSPGDPTPYRLAFIRLE